MPPSVSSEVCSSILPSGSFFFLTLRHDATSESLQDLFALFGIAGVRQQSSDECGPARCQRTARRPDVQRGDVPMPDVLLVDGVQRGLF